jgi:O-antigen biosynthesis protein WbqV
VAEAVLQNNVKTMVLISTDKAVDPTNIMGLTKRMAESICQSLDADYKKKTRFVIVRFGNVLGSTGSVIPLFERQIATGGPLTVTHPEMTRYFMTVKEAVSLVLQAAALSRSQNISETGGISVLEMGKPLKILDLAEQLIRLSGLKPGEDVMIEFTGIRPGEKLHEELFHREEPLAPTLIPGINIASPRIQEVKKLKQELAELRKTVSNENIDESITILKRLIPEFKSERF